MTKTATKATSQPTKTTRPGASPKALTRKAVTKAGKPAPTAKDGKASSPAAAAEPERGAGKMVPVTGMTSTSEMVPVTGMAATIDPPATGPATSKQDVEGSERPLGDDSGPAGTNTLLEPTSWSSEDEAAFQRLLARRRAAGFGRRPAAAALERLSPSELTPSPATVFATIVGLVAERGSVSRDELVMLMARAAFPSTKARPADAGWCRGYISGAVRAGFLRAEDSGPAAAPKAGSC